MKKRLAIGRIMNARLPNEWLLYKISILKKSIESEVGENKSLVMKICKVRFALKIYLSLKRIYISLIHVATHGGLVNEEAFS